MKKLLLLSLSCTLSSPLFSYTYSRISTIERTGEDSTVNGTAGLWDNNTEMVADEGNVINKMTIDSNGNPIAIGTSLTSGAELRWSMANYNTAGVQQTLSIPTDDDADDPFYGSGEGWAISVNSNNKIFFGGTQNDDTENRWTWGRFSNPDLTQELLVVEKDGTDSIIDGDSAGTNNSDGGGGDYFAGPSIVKTFLLDGSNIWVGGAQTHSDGDGFRWTIAQYNQTTGARNLIAIEETGDGASILDTTNTTANGTWDNDIFFNYTTGTGMVEALAKDADGNIWAVGRQSDDASLKWTVVKYNSSLERQLIIVEKTGENNSILDNSGDATATGTWDNGSNFNDGEDSSAKNIAIDSSGNIWVSGEQHDGTTIQWTLAKYNSNGERQLLIVEKPDQTSTINGIAQSWDNGNLFTEDSTAYGMIIDDNDNIFVGGETLDTEALLYWIIAKYDSNGKRKFLIVEKPNQTSTINGIAQSWDNGDNFTGDSGCATLAFGVNQNTLWAGGNQNDGSDTTWALAKYTLETFPTLQALKEHYPNKNFGLL